MPGQLWSQDLKISKMSDVSYASLRSLSLLFRRIYSCPSLVTIPPCHLKANIDELTADMIGPVDQLRHTSGPKIDVLWYIQRWQRKWSMKKLKYRSGSRSLSLIFVEELLNILSLKANFTVKTVYSLKTVKQSWRAWQKDSISWCYTIEDNSVTCVAPAFHLQIQLIRNTLDYSRVCLLPF